jgi:hypothetical protein
LPKSRCGMVIADGPKLKVQAANTLPTKFHTSEVFCAARS